MFMGVFLPPQSLMSPTPPFLIPPHLQGLTAPSKLQEPLQESSCSAGICIHQQTKPTPGLLLLYSCLSPRKSRREICLQTELQVADSSPQHKSWQKSDCCREGRSEASQTLMPCDLQLSVVGTRSLVFAAQSFRGWKPAERLLLISVGF